MLVHDVGFILPLYFFPLSLEASREGHVMGSESMDTRIYEASYIPGLILCLDIECKQPLESLPQPNKVCPRCHCDLRSKAFMPGYQ